MGDCDLDVAGKVGADSLKKLHVCVSVSDAGGLINEDVVGHLGDWAWVIDGATGVGAPLLDAPSDAAWFAQEVDRALRSAIPSSGDRPTTDVLREVIADCRRGLQQQQRREPSERHERPSAAIAMVRITSGGLEMSTLGDCRIAYRDRNGSAQLFGTSRIEIFERRTLDMAARLLRDAPALTSAELRERLLPQLQANRRHMNTAGGYWVLNTDPEAADHMDQLTIPADGTTVALGSDGFLRLVELFEVATPDDLLSLDLPAKVEARLNQLRRIEAEDPECRRHLRIKRSDDASFLLARCVDIAAA